AYQTAKLAAARDRSCSVRIHDFRAIVLNTNETTSLIVAGHRSACENVHDVSGIVSDNCAGCEISAGYAAAHDAKITDGAGQVPEQTNVAVGVVDLEIGDCISQTFEYPGKSISLVQNHIFVFLIH